MLAHSESPIGTLVVEDVAKGEPPELFLVEQRVVLAEGNDSIAQRLPGLLADGLRLCCSGGPVWCMLLTVGRWLRLLLLLLFPAHPRGCGRSCGRDRI